MKDLVNEGRHLQDSFKNRLKESPMDAPTGPSKADEHYKINHPILTILKIQHDKGEFSSNRGNTRMQIVFGLKSTGIGNMPNPEIIMRDASNIARDICGKLDNYNTTHNSGRPQQEGNTIIVPVRVEHWTGD
jgi:hypothetical protein